MFLGHWQFFKDFFKIAFLRYLLFWFAIVPIFVKLLSGLPDKLKIPGSDHFLSLSLPFTWWLLWLASLLYFIAFILFHAFCPQFIKRYPSYTEYKIHGHSPRWVIWEFFYAVEGPKGASNFVARIWQKIYFFLSPIRETDKLFQRVVTKKYAEETIDNPSVNPLVEETQTTAFFISNNKLYKISCNPDAPSVDVKEKEIFWEVFGHFAKQGARIRSLISFLIGGTVILLLAVLAQHIYTVAQLIF
jgi:hypothetical protein